MEKFLHAEKLRCKSPHFGPIWMKEKAGRKKIFSRETSSLLFGFLLRGKRIILSTTCKRYGWRKFALIIRFFFNKVFKMNFFCRVFYIQIQTLINKRKVVNLPQGHSTTLYFSSFLHLPGIPQLSLSPHQNKPFFLDPHG